jgi:hypothetical protein
MSPTNNTFKPPTAGLGSYSYLLKMQKHDVASIGMTRASAMPTNVSR